MSRSAKLRLADILEACDRVLDYTSGMSAEEFKADGRTTDAVIRNLQIIGEAVKPLPEATRARDEAVDWRRIAGMRDMLVHAYFGIDLDLVWDVAETKIPPLRDAVRRLLDEPEPT
jgi:uncharacterized protein with HEPN domain